MKKLLIIAAVTLGMVACSSGEYSFIYNGVRVDCTTGYETPVDTVDCQYTAYRKDFSSTVGTRLFITGSSGDQTTYRYSEPVITNGTSRHSFGYGSYPDLKVDTNHMDADGSEKLGIPVFLFVDGDRGSENWAKCVGIPEPGNQTAFCSTPLDLRWATLTVRMKVTKPDGSPGIENCGPGTNCRMAWHAQGYDSDVDRAVNMVAIDNWLDGAITGGWQTVAISPAITDWKCLGARSDRTDYYGCSVNTDRALQIITRNMSILFYNVESTWNPLDPGSYDPGEATLPAGNIEIDWLVVSVPSVR